MNEQEQEMWRQIDNNTDYISKFNALHVGRNYEVHFKGGDSQRVYVLDRKDEHPITIVAGLSGVVMHMVCFRFKKHHTNEEWESYIKDADWARSFLRALC